MRYAYKIVACILLVVCMVVPALAEEEPAAEEPGVVDPEYLTTSGGLTVGASVGVQIYADTVILADEQDLQPRAFSGGPVGGAYFDLSSNLGDVRIFVPTDYQRGSFSFDGSGNLISVRSSTITGYGYVGGTEYSVRFSPYTVPQYRRSDSSTSWQYLYTNTLADTNVEVLDDLDALPLYPGVQPLLIIILVVVGGALLWRCIKPSSTW